MLKLLRLTRLLQLSGHDYPFFDQLFSVHGSDYQHRKRTLCLKLRTVSIWRCSSSADWQSSCRCQCVLRPFQVSIQECALLASVESWHQHHRNFQGVHWNCWSLAWPHASARKKSCVRSWRSQRRPSLHSSGRNEQKSAYSHCLTSSLGVVELTTLPRTVRYPSFRRELQQLFCHRMHH